MSHGSSCGNIRSDRKDQRCAECQDAERRLRKKGRNNYRAHGPMQTASTRTWLRKAQPKEIPCN